MSVSSGWSFSGCWCNWASWHGSLPMSTHTCHEVINFFILSWRIKQAILSYIFALWSAFESCKLLANFKKRGGLSRDAPACVKIGNVQIIHQHSSYSLTTPNLNIPIRCSNNIYMFDPLAFLLQLYKSCIWCLTIHEIIQISQVIFHTARLVCLYTQNLEGNRPYIPVLL